MSEPGTEPDPTMGVPSDTSAGTHGATAVVDAPVAAARPGSEPDAETGTGPQTETPQRVGWLELFYDLVFVVVVSQLSGHLEGDPSGRDLLVTWGYFVIVWNAWFNCVALTNLSHGLDSAARAWVLASMAGIGVMAVGVAPHTHRPGIFALGYAAARLALTPLWVRQRRDNGLEGRRAVLFGVGVSLLWVASIWLPEGGRALAWAVLIVLESSLSMYRPARGVALTFNSSHMLERIGAFVLICFGEAVARLVGSVNSDPVRGTWWAGGFGFVLLASLFWLFYDMAFARVEHAMEKRPDHLGDVLGNGQFLVVTGLIGFAAGLSSAIEAAAQHHHLTPSARWVLAGGVAAVMFGINSLSMDAFRVELGLFRPARGQRRQMRARQEELRAQHEQWLAEQKVSGSDASDSPSYESMRRRQVGNQLRRMITQSLQCFVAPLLVGVLGVHWPPVLIIAVLTVMPLWTGASVTFYRQRALGRTPGPDADQRRAELARADRG